MPRRSLDLVLDYVRSRGWCLQPDAWMRFYRLLGKHTDAPAQLPKPAILTGWYIVPPLGNG